MRSGDLEFIKENARYELFQEKLETNIVNHTLKKYITLYHCGPKKLKKIAPTSINIGTKYYLYTFNSKKTII